MKNEMGGASCFCPLISPHFFCNIHMISSHVSIYYDTDGEQVVRRGCIISCNDSVSNRNMFPLHRLLVSALISSR
jgi:hypothetical protein